MKKIDSILSESIVYNAIKKFFLYLVSCFEMTFFYKLFFGKIDEETQKTSLFYKLVSLFKKGVLWCYDIISDLWIFKLIRKIFCINTTEVASTSTILKFFGFENYKAGFPFLVVLGLFFVTGFFPTMIVAGLCVLIFLLMFFENSFKDKLMSIKFSVLDMLMFIYLFVLLHARNVSIDVQRNEIFIIYFAFVGVYFIFRFYLHNLSRVKMVVSAFACSGIVVCGVGMLQFVTGSYKTTTWTDTALFEDIQGRLVATFENPNVFGEYLLILIPLLFAMFILTDKILWKIVYGGVTLASLVCMILTYSRGCWLGLILGIFVFILMAYPKLLLPVGLLCPFSIFFIPESIITRITSIGNLQDGSTAFRVYLWKCTLDMIKDIWPTGIGLGTNAFLESYRPYAVEAVLAPHSHNTFLHVMCESGIVGLIVFVLILYFTIRQLFISYKETENKNVKIISSALVSGLAALTVQAMFDNTLYNYRMYMIYFAIIAVSSALYSVRREQND